MAEAAGISRQAAHRHLARLTKSGHLRREGAGRGTVYRATVPAFSTYRYPLQGLEEDRVWADTRRGALASRQLTENVERALCYAVTEIVNNSIDHSGGRSVELSVAAGPESLAIEVVDDGVGVFERLRGHFHLPDHFAAVQELSKGKTTTDPERHTGEGLFFVSKVADLFELESNGLRWTVDNARDDMSLRNVPEREGTRARIEIREDMTRTLRSLFDLYAKDFTFAKTKVTVKLFQYGARFVSRSEAKRLLNGLERFEEATLDFKGVEEIGQGFADEVFRVWPAAHPGTRLVPVQMVPAVEFFVRRARR